jgi:mannose-6-phosphate isomerase-like protein (cupin superfamily)
MDKNSTTTVGTVNIEEKLKLFTDYWSPKIIGELNDHKVQVVKIKGEFVWHHHENEDEMFLVIKGHLIIHFKDHDLHALPGEMIIIPHPLEHKTEAPEETHIILIERKDTVNTGSATDSKYTAKDQDKI